MSDLKIERNFKADAETVFAYVTKPEHLVRWWGHEEFTLSDHRLDFTKPGAWSSTMISAEGNKHKMSGEVVAIDPPNSVEFTWGWHDENDARGHNSHVRFEVRPDGSGGTEFTLMHTGLPDDDTASAHNRGWTSTLKRLERLVG